MSLDLSGLIGPWSRGDRDQVRAALARRAVKGRTVDLNGQETWTEHRADDPGGYSAGGGAAVHRPHDANGAQQGPGGPLDPASAQGGSVAATAGGEPARWDGDQPVPRVATAPEDGDDAAAPSARGVPTRPDRDWPGTYMDGWWPHGGHGSQQAGTSSPGGHGPRGRPPGPSGKVIQHAELIEWGLDARKTKTAEVAGLAVLAEDTGRVLMLQRANDPDDPAAGMWEFPGGHIEDGETPIMGAAREWAEETGCQPPRGQITGTWRSGIYEGFVLTVPAEADVPIHEGRDEVVNPDDPDGDQTEALAWWAPGLLRDNPAVRPELAASLGPVLDALDGNQVDKAGSARTLREYWTRHGHGGPTHYAFADAIRWGTDGDFMRCVALVTEHAHMTPGQAKGYCNLRHHEALGYWPAQHAARDRGKYLIPAVVKVGPHGYVHGWIFVGIPGGGDVVHHPEQGDGQVTAHDATHVTVRYGNGHTEQYEHRPDLGLPHLDPAAAEEKPKPGPSFPLDYSGLLDRDYDYSRISAGGWGRDEPLGDLAHLAGFDAHPRIVDDAEIEHLAETGHDELWRGLAPFQVSDPTEAKKQARGFADQFMHGNYYPGAGVYGNGIYVAAHNRAAKIARAEQDYVGMPRNPDGSFQFSLDQRMHDRDMAKAKRGWDVAAAYSGGGVIMRMALDPSANVADYDDMYAEWKAAVAGIKQTSREGKLLADLGRFAITRGYDAIRLPEANGAMVILNRGKVLVSSTIRDGDQPE